MKALHTVRYAILSTAAIAALSLPIFAGASLLDDPTAKARVSVDSLDLNDERDRQELYERLKDQSREICGSTNIRITGSVERSVGNEACYEGTLTAAVERVNNDSLTQLHQQ